MYGRFAGTKKGDRNAANSHYSGHPRDRDLVSVIARVRHSGVRANFYFKPYLQKEAHETAKKALREKDERTLIENLPK